MIFLIWLLAASSGIPVNAALTNILQTNDDGWVVAAIRAQNDALVGAGYNVCQLHSILFRCLTLSLQVVVSAPAVDKSGTGSSTATPTPLTSPCEYNSCPAGSPAEGFNASNTRYNYVNAFPVDSVRYGIQTLSPQFFNSVPDLVVSGPNVGSNLGSTVLISGTVGAASEAALEGVPSIAFSGVSGSNGLSQVSYTTLDSSPTSTATKAARLYSNLSLILVNQLLTSAEQTGSAVLPHGISLNVNYPSINGCGSTSSFHFVLSRINSASGSNDVSWCGSSRLPTESSVVGTSGCFVSISVFNASTKGDVDASTQGVVLAKIQNILTCL